MDKDDKKTINRVPDEHLDYFDYNPKPDNTPPADFIKSILDGAPDWVKERAAEVAKQREQRKSENMPAD